MSCVDPDVGCQRGGETGEGGESALGEVEEERGGAGADAVHELAWALGEALEGEGEGVGESGDEGVEQGSWASEKLEGADERSGVGEGGGGVVGENE